MTPRDAVQTFTFRDLRALAKCRGLRWYSMLRKHELAFRLFGLDSYIKQTLVLTNQLRRYRLVEPSDRKQWVSILR